MAFVWKDPKDIWKGEGIYHLTFCVVNRVALLGRLVERDFPDSQGHSAFVEATALGNLVYREFNNLRLRYPQMEILAKQIMPDHLHVVVWMHEGFDGSIKMVARGFSQGCSKLARRHQAAEAQSSAMPSVTAMPSVPAMSSAMPSITSRLNRENNNGTQQPPYGTQQPPGAPQQPSTPANPYDCGNGANTLFSTPFIRTLSHRHQLRSLIDYTHANPDNALLRRLNPDLYVIRRNIERGGLHFDAMGKARLLDWPDRQVIALSRSLTSEQIAHEVNRALLRAEAGAVTYTAAINDGEKAVAKAIRGAGYPLVVMMLDGFPPEGTEAARYFHPSGVYHEACGRGLLYLMAPIPDNYLSPHLIALTEAELQRKAAQKGHRYHPIPHTATRWRMIAGNVMLRMIAE